MPKATDKSFTDKLNNLWNKKTPKYRSSRLSQGFILTHYAAEVEYSTEGWLEKNKDPLNDNITQLLIESSEKQIRNLFTAELTLSQSGKLIKKGIFRTVAQRHKEQLNHLMSQLNSTHPHFVRCIIPNHEKLPHRLDNHLVLDQLRCNGVLEGIRIARTGYPNRLFFSEFRQRYEVLVSGMPKGYVEGQKACQLILSKLKLDGNLYKVGLTKVFFKSGVLAELEERREKMVRQILTQFQSIARGALQRQKVRKTLFKAQATSIIKRNFETYLELKENPWWKLYVKMAPLLLASQDSGHSKAQDIEIKKLETTVKQMEEDAGRFAELQRKRDSELETVMKVLEGERQIALDKEEILKRSQQRESDLEEQLTGALDDLDRLEIQCEELLSSKKKIDSEAENLKLELANGAHLIGILEQEKSKLKEQIFLLEDQIEQSSTQNQVQRTEIEGLNNELDYLRKQLEKKDSKIQDLKVSLQQAQDNLSQESQNSQVSLANSQAKNRGLVEEIEEYRSQLDSQYKAAQEYEDIINKKQHEFDRLKLEFEKSKGMISSIDGNYKQLNDKHQAISVKYNTMEEEFFDLKTKYSKLEQDEKEARRVLQAKVSDESKNDEGRRLLDLKVDELTIKLQQQHETYVTERQKLLGDITAKKSFIDKLLQEKERISQELLKYGDVEERNNKLENELSVARAKAHEATSNRAEIAQLKQHLSDIELELSQTTTQNDNLSTRLREAAKNSDRLHSDVQALLTEKSQLSQQISQLKRFIEDDLSNKENLILEKNKITQDLQNAQQELSTISFEYKKLVGELEKKSNHIRKMRTSFTDEAMTQRTKLNKEKAELEASEKKLREDLESARLQTETLKKQKDKLLQEIEDLKHDVAREQKVANAAQRSADSLETQLQQFKKSYDQQRRDHSESEVIKRKLTASIETLQKELKERSQQLSALQKVVKPHSRSRSMNDKEWKQETEEVIDLAKKLEESERRRKKAEEDKAILEAQLIEERKKSSNMTSSSLEMIKQQKRLGRSEPRESHSISSFPTLHSNFGASQLGPRRPLVDELSSSHLQSSPSNRSLRTTNGIKNAIDSIYQSFENDSNNVKPSRGHFRNHSFQHSERNKENYNDISISDSVKSLNIKNKSVEEIEDLVASYESSKRDLLSVFQETSKKLLDTKDKLAAAEQEKTRLSWELEKSNTESGVHEDVESLRSTVSDLEIRLDAETSKNQELSEGLRLYKNRSDEYYSKLESAETVVLKATRSESFAKAQWKEADVSLSSALAENKKQEDLNMRLQAKIQQLEDQLEDNGIDFTHSKEAQKRLGRELQDLRDRRKQDSVEMEASLNTMRNRYKEEIKSLSEELEKEKLINGEVQTKYRHLQHEVEMHKVKNQFDTLDPSWTTFKTQLENKVKDLTKSNEEAVLAHQDSQKRIGSLLSQIRTMRVTMEEITATRDQLQGEKGVLEKRLNEVLHQVEDLATQQSPVRKGSSGGENEDDDVDALKMQIKIQGEEVNKTFERLKNAETSLGDLKAQLETERKQTEEIKTRKSAIDRENKELHLKVVDLEAQLLGSKSHDTKFLNMKITDLEKQLEEQSKQHVEQSRTFRSNDRSVKDLMGQVSQKEKMVQRLQEDLSRNEGKVKSLQETVENLQSVETTFRLAARRAERETKDVKEKSLRLQKDLEEWKSRYDTLVSNKRNSRIFV